MSKKSKKQKKNDDKGKKFPTSHDRDTELYKVHSMSESKRTR